MMRALLFLGGAIMFATAATPEPAAACSTSVFSRHPCPSAPSVLRTHPYTPYSCGVFSGPGCVPEPLYPLNQVPVLKVEGHAQAPAPLDRDHPVDRLYDLGPLLSKCLQMPDEVRPGMQVTLKLAFKRNGELLAEPRFTYTTHEASDEQKKIYRAAALDMLKRCTPLPITAALGNAIAGRPFVVPITETRSEQDKKGSGVAGDAVAKPDDANANEPKP
jgi:hypothetical protein